MTCQLRPSISAPELWFRDIPPSDGRQGPEALPSSADGPPLCCLQAYLQSRWPISPNRHRHELRHVVAPPRQLLADDQAGNSEPGGLWLATEDCHRQNRWPCSTAGSLPAPVLYAGPESSAGFV